MMYSGDLQPIVYRVEYGAGVRTVNRINMDSEDESRDGNKSMMIME